MMTNEITDSLAIALCMQLSADYDELHERLGTQPKMKLFINTYNRVNFITPPSQISSDKNTLNLYNSIVRKYKEYADIITTRKHR